MIENKSPTITPTGAPRDIGEEREGGDYKIVIFVGIGIFSAIVTVVIGVVFKRKRGQRERKTTTDKTFTSTEEVSLETVEIV